MMEDYRKNYSKQSLGASLNFKQLIAEKEPKDQRLSTDVSEDLEGEIDNYALRIWLNRSEKMDYVLKSFKQIGLPINYNYLNYAFYNEDNELIMKENFHRDGKFTINKGIELIQHINFVHKVRDDYSSKLNLIEDYRIDWTKKKGDLIKILFTKKDIDPKKLYQSFKSYKSTFRMIIIPLFKEKDYYFFDCLDTHTGGRFSLQISKRQILVNLKPDSCGNVVFRLLSNLQKHISSEISIEIDNQDLKILN